MSNQQESDRTRSTLDTIGSSASSMLMLRQERYDGLADYIVYKDLQFSSKSTINVQAAYA